MTKYNVRINWCSEEIEVIAQNKAEAITKAKDKANMFPDMDLTSIEVIK